MILNILYPVLTKVNWLMSQWWFWIIFPFLLFGFLAITTQPAKNYWTALNIEEEKKSQSGNQQEDSPDDMVL